jgi:hypothetical protein
MKFEWDPHKADSNLKKHGVSFQEAASVLGDVLSITCPDPASLGEGTPIYHSGNVAIREGAYGCTHRPRRQHSDH